MSVTDGKSLLNCKDSFGLFLFYIVAELNIPFKEQRHILESVLFDEVTVFLTRQAEAISRGCLVHPYHTLPEIAYFDIELDNTNGEKK